MHHYSLELTKHIFRSKSSNKKRNMYSHHFFADDSSTSDCNGLDECYRMCPIRFRKVF